MGLRLASPVLLCLAVAACGGTQRPADLFLIKRSGKIPGANLTLLVSDDGAVSCNGGPKRQLPGALLVRARGLTEDLAADARKPITGDPPVNSVYRFRVRSGSGTVDWIDGSLGLPQSFLELSQFTRIVAKTVCGLER